MAKLELGLAQPQLVSRSDLLRWYLIGSCPQVYLLINIYTRNNKEDSRTPGSTREKAPQSEDDSSLVLLDHLDCVEEGEGEGDDDQEDGEEGEKMTAKTRTFFTSCNVN